MGPSRGVNSLLNQSALGVKWDPCGRSELENMRFTPAQAVEAAERVLRGEGHPSPAMLRAAQDQARKEDSVWRLLGGFVLGIALDLVRPRNRPKKKS